MEKEQLLRSTATFCYTLLTEEERQIYDKATKIFTENECIGDVLSILVMDYQNNNNINTREEIIADYSKIYDPFILTPVIEWTIQQILELKKIKNGDILYA